MIDLEKFEPINIIHHFQNGDSVGLAGNIEIIAVAYILNIAFIKGKKTYALYHDFKPKRFSVKQTPDIVNINLEEKNNAFMPEDFKKCLEEFINKISNIGDHIDLNIFYNNLKSLRIEKKHNSLYHKLINEEDTIGLYDFLFNKITLLRNENQRYILFHELLHMASSCYLRGIGYSGFNQINLLKLKTFGDGLTEGYTSLLCERYFNETEKNMPVKDCASKLEIIIGREEMENMYFRADLFGLVKELSKYDSVENIMDFINSMDYIYKHINDVNFLKGKYMVEALYKVNVRLIDWHSKKMMNYYNKGLMTEQKLINNLSSYINLVGTKLDYIDYEYEYLDKEDIEEILKDNLKGSYKTVEILKI